MIDLGAVYQVAVDVADASGNPTNPDDATLTITLPDGTVVSPAVPAPTTVGQVRVDYVTVQAGRHVWRLVTSTPTTAYADVFDVEDAVAHGIVSLAEGRAQLNLGPHETVDDDELRGYIAGATSAVEKELGRVVVRRTFTDRFELAGATTQVLLTRVPGLTLTSVAAADGSTTWNTTDLQLNTETGLVTVISGAPLTGTVNVVYEAGLVVIPWNFRLAGKIILQHLWEVQRGRMGGVSLGGSDEPFMTGRGYAVPRRAQELLGTQLPGVA
ncbi:hypothetical protein [Streptomyces sp. NPDC094468]|uniref:hypothetical protein n=1 Tax=Streptomyces sp. NPDC094468 TaxID=3366066 RepID=UPI0038168E4B